MNWINQIVALSLEQNVVNHILTVNNYPAVSLFAGVIKTGCQGECVRKPVLSLFNTT